MKPVDPYPILEMRIRTGVYPPGSRLASERELAVEFAVHRSAIRRSVARLETMGLLERRSGYRPIVRRPEGHPPAPNTIALLMGNEPLFHAFQQVLRGCERELTAGGYRLVYMDTLGPTTEATRERERRALEDLIAHPVAAVLLWCQDPEASLPTLCRLQDNGTVIVAVDRPIPGLNTDFVGVDNARAARNAVSHLVALGHRRIGFATHRENVQPVQDRADGYHQALLSHGLPVDDACIYQISGHYQDKTDGVEKITRLLLKDPNPPTAMFAVNDILAFHLLHALEAVGLRVPEDVAVVGFDDSEALAMHAPVLTSVRQPYEAMGGHAAALARERLDAPILPLRHLLLDTSLVVRASTVPSRHPSNAPQNGLLAGVPLSVPASAAPLGAALER